MTGGWKAVDDLDGDCGGQRQPARHLVHGVTMWVVDSFYAKIHAYKMSDKERDSSKDCQHARRGPTTPPASGPERRRPLGGRVCQGYSYNLNTAHDASKDFSRSPGRTTTTPTGSVSDGETVGLAINPTTELYGYNQPKTRDAQGLHHARRGGQQRPTGIWSDGACGWPTGLTASSTQPEHKDPRCQRTVPTLAGAGNNNPYGIWSAATMWVADSVDHKVYSYNMPPPAISDVTPNMPPPAISDATTLVTNLDPVGTGVLPVFSLTVTLYREGKLFHHRRPSLGALRVKRYPDFMPQDPDLAQYDQPRWSRCTATTAVGPPPTRCTRWTTRDDFLSAASFDFYVYHEYIFTARPGAFLDAGATYWIVFKVASSGSSSKATVSVLPLTQRRPATGG